MTILNPRYVQFSSPELPGVVSRPLLNGPTVTIQHHGEGWQHVARLMNMSFTEWQGAAGMELQIPVLFDGFPDKPVESGIGSLEKMQIPIMTISPPRPPLLVIDSGGDIAWDYSGKGRNKLWVIGVFAQADYTSNADFKRVRQFGTVTLYEWIPDPMVAKKKKIVVSKPVKTPSGYTVVQKGDTLLSICSHYYHGDKDMWRKVAAANGLRVSAALKPPAGKLLKMPNYTAW